MIKAQNMAGGFNWSNEGADTCQEVIYSIEPTWPTQDEWNTFLAVVEEFFMNGDNPVYVGLEQDPEDIALYLTFRIFS